MNTDLTSRDSDLNAMLGDLVPKLDKNTLTNTIKKLKEDAPSIAKKMQENEAWKKAYDEYDWHLWWNEYSKSDLEEKKTETIFLLTKASQMQLDAVTVIMQLSILIGQMECEINKQQKTIVGNQNNLAEQQKTLSEQNKAIQNNQQKLNEQNEKLKRAQDDIRDQNERLIKASEVLKALRQIGDSNSEQIGKVLSNYEHICLRLNEVNDRLEKKISSCRESIPDLFESILMSAEKITSQTKW